MRFPDLPMKPACLLVWAVSMPLAACSTFESGGAAGPGSTLGNLMRYGSTSQPPIASAAPVEAADCPGVLVIEGRSAVKVGSSQVSIANVARECIERQGGSIAVKVGIEARALLGTGGGSNRFDVPVVFVLRQGDQVLASRTRRITVSIPPGQAQGSGVIVEPDMIVPAGTSEYDIEVGLGGSAPVAGSTAPRRRRGA